ncbi:uncharacterized protein CLUP02_07858 [Colletotrichum lupini]|uniref:Uncharacterized protein n=1 Tax=Colletotrichum lupini TaxID=145971 RepID=A0A9Q8WH33_9PEZI|nr:uncharacterized protein CLUP02_07858 [Colletotrichum lupini]UQC82370.1 hypothetical protein CLUP02_07858 [Colletotrichum lupini]
MGPEARPDPRTSAIWGLWFEAGKALPRPSSNERHHLPKLVSLLSFRYCVGSRLQSLTKQLPEATPLSVLSRVYRNHACYSATNSRPGSMTWSLNRAMHQRDGDFWSRTGAILQKRGRPGRVLERDYGGQALSPFRLNSQGKSLCPCLMSGKENLEGADVSVVDLRRESEKENDLEERLLGPPQKFFLIFGNFITLLSLTWKAPTPQSLTAKTYATKPCNAAIPLSPKASRTSRAVTIETTWGGSRTSPLRTLTACQIRTYLGTLTGLTCHHIIKSDRDIRPWISGCLRLPPYRSLMPIWTDTDACPARTMASDKGTLMSPTFPRRKSMSPHTVNWRVVRLVIGVNPDVTILSEPCANFFWLRAPHDSQTAHRFVITSKARASGPCHYRYQMGMTLRILRTHTSVHDARPGSRGISQTPRQKNHRISQFYAMMGKFIWALASSLTLCRSEISLFAELPVPRSHRLQRLLHHPGASSNRLRGGAPTSNSYLFETDAGNAIGHGSVVVISQLCCLHRIPTPSKTEEWPRPSRRIQTQPSGGSLKANADFEAEPASAESLDCLGTKLNSLLNASSQPQSSYRNSGGASIRNLIDKELRRQHRIFLITYKWSQANVPDDHHAVIKRTNWRSVLLISQRFPSLSEVGISAEEPANLQIYATKKLVTACGLAVAKGTRLFASRDKRHWSPSCSSLQIPTATNANSPRFGTVARQLPRRQLRALERRVYGDDAGETYTCRTETRPRWLAVVEDDIVGIPYARRRRPLPPAHQIYVIVFTMCRPPREPLIELAGSNSPEDGRSSHTIGPARCLDIGADPKEKENPGSIVNCSSQIHQGNRLLSPTGPSCLWAPISRVEERKLHEAQLAPKRASYCTRAGGIGGGASCPRGGASFGGARGAAAPCTPSGSAEREYDACVPQISSVQLPSLLIYRPGSSLCSSA